MGRPKCPKCGDDLRLKNDTPAPNRLVCERGHFDREVREHYPAPSAVGRYLLASMNGGGKGE